MELWPLGGHGEGRHRPAVAPRCCYSGSDGRRFHVSVWAAAHHGLARNGAGADDSAVVGPVTVRRLPQAATRPVSEDDAVDVDPDQRGPGEPVPTWQTWVDPAAGGNDKPS